jgi:hypothetical protein
MNNSTAKYKLLRNWAWFKKGTVKTKEEWFSALEPFIPNLELTDWFEYIPVNLDISEPIEIFGIIDGSTAKHDICKYFLSIQTSIVDYKKVSPGDKVKLTIL